MSYEHVLLENNALTCVFDFTISWQRRRAWNLIISTRKRNGRCDCLNALEDRLNRCKNSCVHLFQVKPTYMYILCVQFTSVSSWSCTFKDYTILLANSYFMCSKLWYNWMIKHIFYIILHTKKFKIVKKCFVIVQTIFRIVQTKFLIVQSNLFTFSRRSRVETSTINALTV